MFIKAKCKKCGETGVIDRNWPHTRDFNRELNISTVGTTGF
jgi:hypothetical protein